MLSSDATNVTSCCVGGSGGSGGESKRRRTEITLQNSGEKNNKADALLELGKERLKAAQAELALAQQNVMNVAQNLEDIRQKIRSSGCYEVDSLLRLSHDDLFHIMCFLDVNDVGRCTMVCHVLNNQTGKCWESFEARLLTHNSLRSPSATNSRERVLRYLAASKFATQIGAIGDHLSKHTIVYNNERHPIFVRPMYRRVDNHCTGCNLPDLNIDLFDHVNVDLLDGYELYVRLSRSSNNNLLTEGFVSNDRRFVPLTGLDFSTWPEAMELKRTVVSLGDEFIGQDNSVTLVSECMNELTVVLLAMNKTTLKPSLIATHRGFGTDIDLYVGDGEVECSPTGYLSVFSHRPFRADRRVQLRIRFPNGTFVLRDPQDWEWELFIEVMSGFSDESVIDF